MGESQCLTIGPRQVDDLLEELPGLVGCLVEADACEDDERPRQFRAGLERCRSPREAGPRLGASHRPSKWRNAASTARPNLLGSSIGRRQLPGAVEEEGRGPQGSTCARVARPHPRARRPPTRPARRRRRRVATRGPPDPRASSASRAWISLRRTKSAMSYAPAASNGWVKRIRSRSTSTMPARIAGTRPAWRSTPVAASTIVGRRMSVCRRSEQEVTALGRERLESRLNELVERLGHRQQLPRLDDRLAAFQRAGDLEREERIAPGRLVDLRQERSRHGEVEVLADDRVQRPGVEGTDRDRMDPLRRQAASDLEQRQCFPATRDERARVRRARPEVVAPRSRSPRPTQRRAIERRRPRRAAAARRSRPAGRSAPQPPRHADPARGRPRRRGRVRGRGRAAVPGRAHRARLRGRDREDRRAPRTTTRSRSPPEARAGPADLVPSRRPRRRTRASSCPCPRRPRGGARLRLRRSRLGSP